MSRGGPVSPVAVSGASAAWRPSSGISSALCSLRACKREYFIDNLLVRIHFIIEMIWWTGLAPWEFESTLLEPARFQEHQDFWAVLVHLFEIECSRSVCKTSIYISQFCGMYGILFDSFRSWDAWRLSSGIASALCSASNWP